MIYITGDTHAEFRRFNTNNFPEQRTMTKNDYLIICGDFGGVWFPENHKYSKEQKHNLDWLNLKNFTLLFVDGNHENHDILSHLPEKEWKGGKVGVVRESVLHLKRGQVFNINGIKIFTFGGARSHDINGLATREDLQRDYTAGILNPNDPNLGKKRMLLISMGIPFRIEGTEWWRAEQPSKKEMQTGLENLKKVNNKVDFIITHECASSTLPLVACNAKIDPVTEYLQEIKEKTKYKKWFFGHHHDNRNLPDNEILIYDQIIRIA